MRSVQWIPGLRPTGTSEGKRATNLCCVPKSLTDYCLNYIKTCWDFVLLKLENICSESRCLLSWARHCFWNSDSAELPLTLRRGAQPSVTNHTRSGRAVSCWLGLPQAREHLQSCTRVCTWQHVGSRHSPGGTLSSRITMIWLQAGSWLKIAKPKVRLW